MNNSFRVLLVEDDKFAQKIAMVTFTSLNCQIDVADTGAKALELANKNHYDLIIMDLGLPDMHGTEVAKSIKESDSKNSNTFIVALTAHAAPKDQEECKKTGMTDFLTKPLSLDTVQDLLVKFKK